MTEKEPENATQPARPETPSDLNLDAEETFRISLRYYKENESKSSLNYEDRLALVALSQQSCQGPLIEDKVSALGPFDVIGRERRSAWAKLGQMPRDEAKVKFVGKLGDVIPGLYTHLESVKRQKIQQKQKEEQVEKKRLEEEKEDDLRRKEEDQRRQIQDALNKQTYNQFREYAAQQYPNDPDRQAVLIKQLQEQHYRQYMQQVYQQQMESQASQAIEAQGGQKDLKEDTKIAQQLESIVNLEDGGEDDHKEEGEEDDHECTEECGFCCDEDVGPASMWTKKELEEFKKSIREEGGDSIIKVGHGETVTVRVPTHKDGNALFWEFATDNYDIAFGLFFEWTTDENEMENEISVHVSESEDEDLEDDADDLVDERGGSGDLETGSRSALLMDNKGPPTTVIVPIYRRDCHDEVYAGTHPYPGKGVYLLKFDNTYSLWRSKTLYYRVYYTK